MQNFWDNAQPLPAKGTIQLQTHGGEIRWRNIFIREIPAQEANEILKRHSGEGYTCVFNGSTLEGWEGAVENYEVRDGAIVLQTRQGWHVVHEGRFANFAARLEIQLPPAATTVWRYGIPGRGDPAYAAMTELQVLDTNYPGKLDPRQVHGSAYGMVAAKTGYLRRPGVWNYQEVTVQGSRIKVELNGTVILDADLSQVTEFMGGSPHPGKDLTEGHFGFAGHSDPVQFRDIAIKKLD